MNLRSEEVSELRRLVAEGAGLPLRLPPLTLGAAIELACTAWYWRLAGRQAAFERFREWESANATLGEAWAALAGTRPMVAEYSATSMDIRSVTDVTGQALFGNRFRKSLKELGRFSNEFANGLGGALEEMVDNVLQHASKDLARPAPAIMAFEVADRAFTFSVGDVGRGVLKSLRENERWNTLADDEVALNAVVVHQASRRGAEPGTGFSLVVRTLADLGSFRYRTGKAYVIVETGTAAHTRTTVLGASTSLFGVQLVVSSSRA